MTALPDLDLDAFPHRRLWLNEDGRFYNGWEEGSEPVLPKELPGFLEEQLSRPDDVTDVFVWVHGWRTDEDLAVSSGGRLFSNMLSRWEANRDLYPKIEEFRPWFVVVLWPSNHLNYFKVRNRTRRMTAEGEAEFFLAKLLDHIDNRDEGLDLRGPGGFYLHCLGHSFGGRVLTAAINEAARPSHSTWGLLEEMGRRRAELAPSETAFDFNVDTMLVFQMAAPASGFAEPFTRLLSGNAPFSGNLVLTHSKRDKANNRLHWLAEREVGIGLHGARQPAEFISQIRMRPADEPYPTGDFHSRIVNVNADDVFVDGQSGAGAHFDIFHEESVHLALSLVNECREPRPTHHVSPPDS